MLSPGLYEQIINQALNSELLEIPEACKFIAPIDRAEASKALAQYLTDVVQKGMENLLDNGGDVSAQIELANQIVTLIQTTTQEADFAALGVDRRAERLLALLRRQDPRLAAGKYFDSNNAAIYTMDITPYSYQQEILDKLEAERTIRGYTRNLVVAATGTGKTVISALDYKRFCKQNPGKPCRLLFIAHRKEILRQSLYTFQAVLKDANFGELFVGNDKPESIDHLFLSIQTFNSQDFTAKTAADFYDYIVVDEFHHAAAPTYQKSLSYYNPKILLGLTATPERMDSKSVLPYFHHRIAAEIRLPEAIDRKLLCPFQYFGVTDTVDLSTLKWSAGGYDKGELSNLYTLSGTVANRRADLVVNSLLRYVTDIDEVKGLGFCVSIKHAEFMCSYFNQRGIPSIFLTGKSNDEERTTAKSKLVSGEIRFIFVVDIYNEGVDIPEVNTVLFLRPTESLTIFLQQLGRGLRLAESKDCLTVLDFIGQANKRYRFEDKFAALLSNTSRSVTREIKDGFVSAPKGCYIQLEKKAARYILDNIRASYGNTTGLVSRVASFTEDSGLELTLANFLDYYHLDPRAIYKFSSFSRLCARADAIEDFSKPATVREGVKWLPEKQLDVFFVTLNKADKDYSPTTMYKDYSINESLFHWQSQSTTAADSPTGQRYIHHRERGSKVLLFVREFKTDRISGGAEAYTFLGTANYVKHEGSRPMNITWKLDRPIPAKFLKKTNKLVIG